MIAIKSINKSTSGEIPTNITKPFIFRDTSTKNTSYQELYTRSHIFMNSMALSALNISWGSEVVVANPKNDTKQRAHVFASEKVDQNCIQLSEYLKNRLEARPNKCLMVCGKLDERMIPFEEIEEEEIQGKRMDYAYQKNESYQLISKIINKKLKIQLKLLRCWDSPKLYYLELSKPIRSFSLLSILGYLKKEEYYRVYPQNNAIEIFVPENVPIRLQLTEVKKPKTIDTEIIMNLIQNLYKITLENANDIKMSDQHEQLPKMSNEDGQLSIQDYQTFKDKQPSTNYQTNFEYDKLSDVPPNYLMKKISTDFRRSNETQIDPIYLEQQTLTIKRMQQRIDELEKQIQNISFKPEKPEFVGGRFPIKKMQSGSLRSEQSIFEKNVDLEKKLTGKPKSFAILDQESGIEKVKEALDEKLDTEKIDFKQSEFINKCFNVTEKDIDAKTRTFLIQHKLSFQWSQFSPYSFKEIGKSRQKLKILKSNSNFIFYGLINKSIADNNTSWKSQGSIGCFIYNSRIYLNGQEIKTEYKVNEVLAKEGQTLQIKLNKLFKEITWIVDGREKIKAPLSDFDIHYLNEEWVPYVELFSEGDTVEFINELL